MNYRILVAVAALLLIIYVYLRRKENAEKLSVLNYCYVALLFSMYPLVFSPIQGYYSMGIFKCRIWAVMTICLVAYEAAFLVVHRKTLVFKYKLTAVDASMVVFLFAETISFVIAPDKKLALVGAEGWYTGLLFQYGIVLIYFSVSRFLKPDMNLIRIILVSAMVVFAIGILHRFLIDPIGIYSSLSENEHVRFLSTIGQATWYSAYLCVIFPLGLHTYLYNEKRVISGAFLFLAAATFVTQNSDTAYVAFFVIMLAYLYKAMTDKDCCGEESAYTGIWRLVKSRHVLNRYGQAVVIMSVAILCIGVLERLFNDHMPQLDDLSLELAQGYLPVIGIIAGVFLILLGNYVKSGEQFGRGILIFVMIVVVVTVVGISFAQKSAGDLYFSWGRDWGNGRGLIWTRTIQMYADLPLINKLFGVGPGHFYGSIIGYTELVLANAHNEWLTMLVESGIVGGISYLAVFIVAVFMMLRNNSRTDGEMTESGKSDGCIIRHLEYAIVVTVLAYIVHGMFNYQQCISTPMMFALLGIVQTTKFAVKMD